MKFMVEYIVETRGEPLSQKILNFNDFILIHLDILPEDFKTEPEDTNFRLRITFFGNDSYHLITSHGVKISIIIALSCTSDFYL